MRYFRILFQFTNRALDPMDEGLTDAWPAVVFLSALVALPVTALVRGAHMLTLSHHNNLIVLIGLLPGFIISAISLTALTWGSRQAQRAARPERAYVIGLLASVVALLVTVESVAGILAALWHLGVITSQPGVTPSLWSSERYFIWHILKSFPFLKIDQAFNWGEPRGPGGIFTGVSVVIIKIVLLLPLLRIAKGAYWWLRTKPNREYESDDFELNRVPVILLGALLLSWGYLTIIWPPNSIATRKLEEYLPDSVEVASRNISLDWIPATIQWLPLGVMMVACWTIGLALLLAVYGSMESIWSITLVIVSVLLWIPLLTVLSAAASLLLVRSGLANSVPPLPANTQITVGLENLLWGFFDAVPALDITRTLHWERPPVFAGWQVGLISMMFRFFALVALLTLPWLLAKLIHLYRPHDDMPVPAIYSARLFTATLAALDKSLLRVERMRKDESGVTIGDSRLPKQLSDLETCCRRVADAFGVGPVAVAATQALAAAESRFNDVFSDNSPNHTGPSTTDRVAPSRAELLSRWQTFVAAATTALDEAVPTNAPFSRQR
ncbi:hypothetical protein ABZ345_45535 [Lentzea sp. NPDC005914]|uniref:hypothetical protein n=1 Tax=Lentzea sp. NPDC005914 TaxID=3154572 RepID=UPI0033FFFF47